MAATESLAARAEAMLNRLAEAQAEAASLQARTHIEVARARASGIAAGLRAASCTYSLAQRAPARRPLPFRSRRP